MELSEGPVVSILEESPIFMTTPDRTEKGK